jgi:hypothetical protein
MNEMKSVGLRLPVQAVVDRTTADTTLADGAGVEASGPVGDAVGGIAAGVAAVAAGVGKLAKALPF